MTEGEKRRQRIFEVYANNLELLVKNNFIQYPGYRKGIYICPICLKEFDKIDDTNNPLTLEDAPPKSLGGKADILTCKSCNNISGHKIDVHLVERMRELDSREFKKGSKTQVRIKIGSETYQGLLSVKDDGTLEVFHSKKNNHPVKLDDEMDKMEIGDGVLMEFLKTRVIPENLEYALLKTAYLLLFQHFGYAFILDPTFDPIRKQLLNPDLQVIPTGYWLKLPYPIELNGTYCVLEKELESFFVIFSLDTGLSSRMFGIIIPLPGLNYEPIIKKLNEQFDKNPQIELTLYPGYKFRLDYLSNTKNIELLLKWISEKQPK